jgi:hypothetical protein
MKLSTMFALIVAGAVSVLLSSGCNGVTGPAPLTSPIPVPPNATPPAKWLYVDHYGKFYAYALPISKGSTPQRTLTEWPGSKFPPVIAVDPFGNVALASPTQIKIFHPPIESLDPSKAILTIPLTPAITNIGTAGANLVDLEYDPTGNLWLFNDLGPQITELRTPFSKHMVADLSIVFGAPGSKTAGFNILTQGRFDVNSTLYVYATAQTKQGGSISKLFKIGFPYAKPPSPLNVNLLAADFVDSSQYLPQSHNPATVLLGQYDGPLHSPHPGDPPSPPVDVLSQFAEPLQPVNGLFPSNIVNEIVGALTADAPRQAFYTLDAGTGSLDAFPLPMQSHSQPLFSIGCIGGASMCSHQSEHLFLAP